MASYRVLHTKVHLDNSRSMVCLGNLVFDIELEYLIPTKYEYKANFLDIIISIVCLILCPLIFGVRHFAFVLIFPCCFSGVLNLCIVNFRCFEIFVLFILC